MASPHSPTLRSLYRRLLRELPPRIVQQPQSKQTILSHPSPLQRRIRSSISASNAESGSAAPKIQETEQFIQYIQAQRLYTTLVERYNPGMTMSEEERVRLTARRVGMDLPIEVDAESK